jgi:hypothetical protein
MVLSSPKIAPLGTEHSTGMSWVENHCTGQNHS